MTGSVYDYGATADRVYEVQMALVRGWVVRNRVKLTKLDAATVVEMIDRCSAELILPRGHLATVFRRMGFEQVAAAYLAHAKEVQKAVKARSVGRGDALRAKEAELREAHARKRKMLAATT